MLSHWVLNHLKCKSQKIESELLHIYEKVDDFLINGFAICFFHYSGWENLLIKLHGLACNKKNSQESMLKQSFFASLPHLRSLGSLFIWPRAENSLKELPCMKSWYRATCKSCIVFYSSSLWKKQKDIYKKIFQCDLL